MTVKDFISDVTPISLFEFVIDVPAGKFEDDEIGAYLEIIEVFDLILDSWLTSDEISNNRRLLFIQICFIFQDWVEILSIYIR